MDSNGVWLLALGGFAAALGAWLFVRFRLGGSWLIRRARAGYMGWFAEAVEIAVKPEFDAIKATTIERAAEIKSEALAAAAQVKVDADRHAVEMSARLDEHTREEGEAIRAVVKEEVAPLRQLLDERTPMFEQINETLQQQALIIESHLTADELIQRSVDARFQVAGEDLLRGQSALMARLESIEAAVTTVTTTVTTSPQGEETKERK